MHGLLFQQFRKFVTSVSDFTTWIEVTEEASLKEAIYLPTELYPDEQMTTLFHATAKKLSKDPQLLLEEFGIFITPDLLSIYGSLLAPEWGTLDFLEHTETIIHRAVRMNDKNAAPPHLRCRRLTKDEVEVDYSSKRRMHKFGVGIIRGVAAYYNEKVVITEKPYTAADGTPSCIIHVQVVEQKR